MSPSPLRRTQKLTIIAKDPSVRVGGRILTARIDVPAEELLPGPRGYRVQVIDYDSSTGLLYPPLEYRTLADGSYNDPFDGEDDDTLLGDPGFHAQNVYAVVMRTLARFELALGRRVSWSFGGHQIQVAPHAFMEANAFYSHEDRALLFGYFPKPSPAKRSPSGPRFPDMIFTALSHDVVAHETTHALLDGLRPRYKDPSSPDQAAFHEGFADVVALLSIFSLQDVVQQILDRAEGEDARTAADLRVISADQLTRERLGKSLLLALGKEIGQGLTGRDVPLRQPTAKAPEKGDENPELREPHDRGEVLVGAMMNGFLEIWHERIQELLGDRSGGTAKVDRRRVVEDGAVIADQLLTMAIRAIDYCPPTDLQFSDFLSALLTADRELRPDDARIGFRRILRENFGAYGITPTSKGDGTEPGVWEPPDCVIRNERVHLDSLRHDRDEVFRFLWENRDALGLERDAYTRVLSVRPAVRVNPDDGFVLRETVAEYHQILNVIAAELKHLGIRKPKEMPADQQVTLYGGGALVFDEFGRLKFHIRNRLLNPQRQTDRLAALWAAGSFESYQILEREAHRENTFARMHLRRFGTDDAQEGAGDGELF
jgi:hypothetical protein